MLYVLNIGRFHGPLFFLTYCEDSNFFEFQHIDYLFSVEIVYYFETDSLL